MWRATTCLIAAAVPFGVHAQIFNPTANPASMPRERPTLNGIPIAPEVLPQPAANPAAPVEKVDSNTPVVMVAQKMDYDSEAKIAVASGDVEITQGPRVLLAQKVTYYETSDLVIAEGNVSMLEPDGNVYFADKVELKQEMKTGTIAQFAARLPDGSIFAAKNANRVSDDVTDLFSAVYTPCKVICDDGSQTTPTWHLRAHDVRIDQAAQQVTYHDATMEFLDVPVIYTPYFAHPTPGADNKSGFMTPTYRFSNNLGSVLEIPYYYTIDATQDMTLTPIYTTLEGPVFKGEYRSKYDHGELSGIGSVTVPQHRDGSLSGDQNYRGHIDARGLYNLSDEWDLGGQLRRTTDDTYLARYGFNTEPLLISRVYAQGINFMRGNTRNNATIQTLAFQGLTAADDSRKSPFVLPLAEFNYTTNPLAYNSRIKFSTNLMSLTRDEGADTRRLSVTSAWIVPYTTASGHMFEAKTSLRGDAYYVQNFLLGNGKIRDGVEHRFIPEASLLWRYPLIRRGYNSNFTIEPLASIIASPNSSNAEPIPNEDSSVPEFTDLNMFSDNRYSGLDRVEGGPRVFYGVRGLWDSFRRGSVTFALGQTLRLSDARQFPLSNDLTSHISDYVGRVAYNINPFSINYRFRLDRDTLKDRRDEISASYSGRYFTLSADYLQFDKDPIIGSDEEISGGIGLLLTPEWTMSTSIRKDLQRDQLTTGGYGLTYQDECFTFILQANRDLASDRDLRDTTSFVAQVFFKNLE